MCLAPRQLEVLARALGPLVQVACAWKVLSSVCGMFSSEIEAEVDLAHAAGQGLVHEVAAADQ